MTNLSTTTCATDLNDYAFNNQLTREGYTIRHIETWERGDHSDSIIVWDRPEITEADLPF